MKHFELTTGFTQYNLIKIILDIEEIHETLGKVGYGLIALHAIAALGHHYIKKDDTLKRMLRFKEYSGIQS